MKGVDMTRGISLGMKEGRPPQMGRAPLPPGGKGGDEEERLHFI
ncbi:MAG: hypothetical protein ACPLPS_05340 [bacterium]